MTPPLLSVLGEQLLDLSSIEGMREIMESTCTIREAADVMQVSRRTIYNWIAQGKVQWIRIAGGQPRIIRRSLFRAGSER